MVFFSLQSELHLNPPTLTPQTNRLKKVVSAAAQCQIGVFSAGPEGSPFLLEVGADFVLKVQERGRGICA